MLFVVLVMLSLCASSYGYYLVYNVTATVKGLDYDWAEAVVTVPLKGYMVLTFADGCDTPVDVNLVLYGYDANTPKKQKVYVELDRNSNGYLGDTTGWYAYGYYNVYLHGTTPFNFEAQLMGKTVSKDIGLGASAKKDVVSSMKGVICVWELMLLDARQDITGTANISATLNNTYTKAVNDTEPSWTNEQIIEGQLIGNKTRGIKPDLEAKGYHEAVLP
jgi:hypothetical protein